MKNMFGGLQWAIFLIASSIAAPIAIAQVFGMDMTETALFIQRTIFIVGIASMIQAFIGHRLPINEGAAGLWWGVFVVYAGMVGVMYPSAENSLQALQSGMIYSGVLFILLALLGVVSKMKKLFTPVITFTYLMLLILQLSGTFIKGMFGIEAQGAPIDGTVLLGSIIVVFIALYTLNHRVKWVSRYSVLLSIGSGWLMFLMLGKTQKVSSNTSQLIELPGMLVYGMPVWDTGMLVTAVFITLLLIANMMASIRVMESLFKNTFTMDVPDRVKQGSIASGINHLLSGLFSSIGPVPISGAAGFVGATKMVSIKPFVIGSAIVIAITLSPDIMALFAALPAPVAYAVTFVIFTKMVEMAFKELSKESDQNQAYRVSAFGLMIGVGLMFVPTESLSELPIIVATILSNGLITGTIIAIAIEQFLLWKKCR